MEMFQLWRADDVAEAVTSAAYGDRQLGAQVRFLAGGTTLVDLMKLGVERPGVVVDIGHLRLDKIEPTPAGGVRIGAMVRNADLAQHEVIREHYSVLSQALLSGASPQLRNMATTGGNLLQRTRCVYFRDAAMPCNKRAPGSGCPAMGGYHRNLAVLGTSEACIASNPSDMNVALMALGATIEIQGVDGRRSVDIDDFFLLPGDAPERETVLRPGELITHVTLPPWPPGTRSLYLKLRDRASYEFALASAAVVVTLAQRSIQKARVALGGVGTRPWRTSAADMMLTGAPSAKVFEAAAAELLRDARPQRDNAFKIELARRSLVHALKTVTTGD